MDYQNSRGFAKDTREHVKPTLSWVFLNSRGHELYEVSGWMEIYPLAGSI
ncbi:hypothetical protein YC2023_033568 [Brassica napus]